VYLSEWTEDIDEANLEFERFCEMLEAEEEQT
jgi:hypothetical protein